MTKDSNDMPRSWSANWAFTRGIVCAAVVVGLVACETSSSTKLEDAARVLDLGSLLDSGQPLDMEASQDQNDVHPVNSDQGPKDTGTAPGDAKLDASMPRDTSVQPDATKDIGIERSDGRLDATILDATEAGPLDAAMVQDGARPESMADLDVHGEQDMAADALRDSPDALMLDGSPELCRDDDGDGVTVCQGDCADDDPGRRPAQFERCDDIDQDCDGLVDERCLGGREAITWTRVLRTPGSEAPFCGGLTRSDDADVQCDVSGIQLAPIALGDWFGLRQRGEPIIAGEKAHASAQFEPLDNFRVTIRIRILSRDEPGRLLDGQVFGYLGFGFENEVPAPGFPGNMTGVAFFPTQLPRFYYHGGPSSGGGYTGVEFNEPVTLQVERVGHELATFVNGQYTGHRVVPDQDASTHTDHPHAALRHIFVACVHCRAVVESLIVERPTNEIQVAERVPCPNLLRNALFEHRTESVPDFWAIDISDVLSGPCCRAPSAEQWRRSLSSISSGDGHAGVRLAPTGPEAIPSRLVQPITLPNLADPLSLTLHAEVEQEAQLSVGLAGCVPEEQVILVTPAENRHQLAFDCAETAATEIQFTHGGGADISLIAAQLSPNPPLDDICQNWRDTRQLVVEGEPNAIVMNVPGRVEISDGLSLELNHEDGVLLVELVGDRDESTLVLDPHGGSDPSWCLESTPLGLSASVGEPIRCPVPDCPVPTTFWRIPFQALALNSAVNQSWALKVTNVQNQIQTSHRLRLFWPETPWRNHLIPVPAYEATEIAPWAVTVKNWVLHPRKVDRNREHSLNESHFALFRGLGLDGIGLVNPHPNEMETWVTNAGRAPQLDLDLQTFFSIPFWRDDAQRQTLFRWADAIAESIETCRPDCPPVHWNILDEPSQAELQACRRDLSTNADRLNLRPELLAFLGPLGCIGPEPCESSVALLACRGAFPALLTALVEDLAARVPDQVSVGINLTRDAGLSLISQLGPVFDHVSYTNNWVGRAVPRQWSLVPLNRFRDEAGALPYVGYNLIGGALGGWRVRSGPSAQAYRGMSLLQVARGALSLRSFVWPPHSAALVDELGDQARLFAALAPTVPRGRLQPHPPTSSPRLVATAFRDEQRTVLLVVNRAQEAIYGGVDVRGLLDEHGRPDTDLGEGIIRAGALWDTWGPFEGHVYQLN